MSCNRRGPRPLQLRVERIRRFAPEFRGFVARISQRSAAVEDLADSYPGLLFALATGYGDEQRRAAAFAAIEDGRKLRQAADLLGLPWWTRKLPASAFVQTLERVPGGTAKLDRAFASLVPDHHQDPGAVRDWFARVLRAEVACHEQFALWMAKNGQLLGVETTDLRFDYACAWAWYSSEHGTRAGSLIRRAWHPDMRARAVREEVRVWLHRLAMASSLAALPKLRWRQNSPDTAYRFVALTRADDFVRESEAMGNCLDQYGVQIETGNIAVFSIRRDGLPVANLEVALASAGANVPKVAQIKGPRNRKVGPQVWRAARAWVAAQAERQRAPRSRRTATPANAIRRAQQALWAPYFEHIGDLRAAAFDLNLRLTEKSKAKARGGSRPT